MYRYSVDPQGEAEGTMDALNLSSSMTVGTSQSGSKAVLAALRALQDKIRRLDSEKTSAIDECNQLKAQIKSMEIDHEHMKQRDALMNNQALLEAKGAYDSLNAAKAVQESDYTKLQEKHREQAVSYNKLKIQYETLEDEKLTLLSKCNSLEKQSSEQDSLLRQFQTKEKEMTTWIIEESRKHEANSVESAKAVRIAQNENAKLKDTSSTSAEKISELEKLVGQLLSVNESLVKQIAGNVALQTRRPFVSAVNGLSPSLARRPKRLTPYVRSRTTARKTKKGWPSVSDIKYALKSGDTDDLKKLHNSYATVFKKVSKKGGNLKKGTSTSSSSSSPKRKTIKTKAKTRLRKYSGATDRDEPNTMHSLSAVSSPFPSQSTMPSSTFTQTADGMSINLSLPSPKQTIEDILRPTIPPAAPLSGAEMDNLTNQLEKLSSGASVTRSPFKQVVETLEGEQDLLQEEYRSLVRKAATDPSTYNEELMNVMTRMQRKADQIRTIRSPVNSP